MPKYSPGPLTLRCPVCKKHEDYRRGDRYSNQGIVRLGREKEGWRAGRVKKQWYVRHLCGHEWWTTHTSAASKPMADIETLRKSRDEAKRAKP